MKLIILHGPGQVGLNNKLLSIKKEWEGAELSEYLGKDLNFGQLMLELGSVGLFSAQRLIVVNTPEELELEKLPEVDNVVLVLVYPKTLASNSKILKTALAKKAQVFNFPEDQEVSVFPYLDLLAEKKERVFLELDKLLREFGGQYILTMIFYLLRRLVLTPKNLPPFILKKMVDQRKNFPIERVKKLYLLTIETDFKIKSGRLDEKLGLSLLTENFLTK